MHAGLGGFIFYQDLWILQLGIAAWAIAFLYAEQASKISYIHFDYVKLFQTWKDHGLLFAIQQRPQSFIWSGPSAKEIQNRFHLVEYEQYVSYITQNVVGFICNTPLILEELTTVLYIAVGGCQSNPACLVQLLCSYTALKWIGNLLMNIQHSIKNIF